MKLTFSVIAAYVVSLAASTPAPPQSSNKFSKRAAPPEFLSSLNTWVDAQTTNAINGVLANISPAGGAAGAVTASPSKSSPDYFYHWTRDAGLSLYEVSEWLASGDNSVYEQKLREYAKFSRTLQTKDNQYGLGVAKFYMDGTPYTGPWCNPQRDGAAARAMSLIAFANHLLAKGSDVSEYYSPTHPATSVIKVDLEYVARSWNADNSGCDIWEEIRGNHFYTRMIQRRALIEGAALANKLGDPGAATYYNSQAAQIAGNMTSFWSADRGFVQSTIDRLGGIDYKSSNIDSQVFLAALHAGLDDGFYTPETDQMIATVKTIVDTFAPLYKINNVKETKIAGVSVPIGVAFGRYPEDKYNGYDSNGPGNPWSLITSAMAEYHYRLVQKWNANAKIIVSQSLASFLDQITAKYGITFNTAYRVGTSYDAGSQVFAEILENVMATGDLYMGRVAHHTDTNGAMWEQWNRGTGSSQGAIHLTWSYAQHTAAARHRGKAHAIVYGN